MSENDKYKEGNTAGENQQGNNMTEGAFSQSGQVVAPRGDV